MDDITGTWVGTASVVDGGPPRVTNFVVTFAAPDASAPPDIAYAFTESHDWNTNVPPQIATNSGALTLVTATDFPFYSSRTQEAAAPGFTVDNSWIFQGGLAGDPELEMTLTTVVSIPPDFPFPMPQTIKCIGLLRRV